MSAQGAPMLRRSVWGRGRPAPPEARHDADMSAYTHFPGDRARHAREGAQGALRLRRGVGKGRARGRTHQEAVRPGTAVDVSVEGSQLVPCDGEHPERAERGDEAEVMLPGYESAVAGHGTLEGAWGAGRLRWSSALVVGM